MNSIFRKKFKLSLRIGMCFGVIISVACILGSLSVLIMKNVIDDVFKLGNKYIPQVAAGNNIEHFSLSAMNNITGYTLSKEKQYLEHGKADLEQLKAHLKTADNLANKFPDLVNLKNLIPRIEKNIREYEKLINDIVAKNEAIAENQLLLNKANQMFMKYCMEFLDSQTEALEKQMASEFISSYEADALKERFKKIRIIQDVLQSDNVIHKKVFHSARSFGETVKIFDIIFEKLSEIKTNTITEQNKKIIDEITDTAKKNKEAMISFLNNRSILHDLNKKCQGVANTMVKEAVAMAETGMGETGRISTESQSSLLKASHITIIGLVCWAIMSACFAWIMILSITKRTNRMIDKVTVSSEQVALTSDQFSGISQSLSQGLTEQAASLQETSASLQGISFLTRRNADNAIRVNTLMNETGQMVDKASVSMDEMTGSMSEIAESAEETSEIIKIIDEISFKTNLLSLNAAIESARAGEAGAGFSVVAEEVRNLAARVTHATKQISELIEKIVKKISHGSESVRENKKLFESVAANVARVVADITEIAEYSGEQAEKIGHINEAVAEMNRVIQQNTANAQESASASHELMAQARYLKAFVDDLVLLVKGIQKRKEGRD
ncbi:methyl-accepting chemotaxis protein [Desulfobacterales bacterium HSG2]|nr:methyl-accepting chemotaxis protein [Desulfobacterales bacterium HSG2]